MTQDEIISTMKKAGFYIGQNDEFEPAWERFAALVAAHEREACAKVCEQLDKESCDWVDTMAIHCAKAIRSRSQS